MRALGPVLLTLPLAVTLVRLAVPSALPIRPPASPAAVTLPVAELELTLPVVRPTKPPAA